MRPEVHPACVAADDAVDGEHHAQRHQHRAGDVEAGGTGDDLVLGQDPLREHPDGDPDRDVDQEDPVPVQQAGQHAAEQGADRATAGHHEAEDAHRLGALTGVGEQAHDQGQGDCRDGCTAESLDGAARDEQAGRWREAAGDRRHGERHHAGLEDPLVAEQVAEPAGEQQEAAERQQVGVDDPGQRGLREAEVGLDRGQRHVDDAHVQHDQQVAQAERVERQPAGPVVEVVHGLSSVSGSLSPGPRTAVLGYDTCRQRFPIFSGADRFRRPNSSLSWAEGPSRWASEPLWGAIAPNSSGPRGPNSTSQMWRRDWITRKREATYAPSVYDAVAAGLAPVPWKSE